MFVSAGYFRGITCPYFASGLCERPYCHFRHIAQEKPGKAKSGSERKKITDHCVVEWVDQQAAFTLKIYKKNKQTHPNLYFNPKYLRFFYMNLSISLKQLKFHHSINRIPARP